MTLKEMFILEKSSLPGPSIHEKHETYKQKKMCEIEVVIGAFDENEMQSLLFF